MYHQKVYVTERGGTQEEYLDRPGTHSKLCFIRDTAWLLAFNSHQLTHHVVERNLRPNLIVRNWGSFTERFTKQVYLLTRVRKKGATLSSLSSPSRTLLAVIYAFGYTSSGFRDSKRVLRRTSHITQQDVPRIPISWYHWRGDVWSGF